MDNKTLIISPFIIMGISTLFILGCIIFAVPLYLGFALAIIFTIIVLLKSDHKIKDMAEIIIAAVWEVKLLCVIIMMIGATTSIWLSSGVVPTIMYYGFTYMEGVNFMVAAFAIMVIVSVFMGTAVGTISTVGIALMGIGKGLGIPAEVIVGVLISGGFIADKISPISGLVNLTMTTVNRDYKEIVKGLLTTLIPVLIITAIIYFILGAQYTSGDYSQLTYYKGAIEQSFNTTLILLMLPILVLALSVIGVNSVLTIAVGLLCGTVFSMFFQQMEFVEVIKGIFWGYEGATVSKELNSMLISGGVVSMIEVIFVVVGGVVLLRIFEKTDIIMPLIDKLMTGVATRNKLIIRTGIISSMLTAITCDQTVGIILPGRILQDKYKEFDLDNIVLARTISDTGTIIAPLMAWNVNAFIIKSITGVSAGIYAPYAVLCYVCPIVSMVIMCTMYRNSKAYGV